MIIFVFLLVIRRIMVMVLHTMAVYIFITFNFILFLVSSAFNFVFGVPFSVCFIFFLFLI